MSFGHLVKPTPKRGLEDGAEISTSAILSLDSKSEAKTPKVLPADSTTIFMPEAQTEPDIYFDTSVEHRLESPMNARQRSEINQISELESDEMLNFGNTIGDNDEDRAQFKRSVFSCTSNHNRRFRSIGRSG